MSLTQKTSPLSGEAIATRLLDNMVVLIFLALALALAMVSPLFLTPDNVLNVIRQVSVIIIISVGFTLVLGSGEIDLSVGAVMGLTGVFMAQMMVAGVPSFLAVILGLGIGVLLGFVNAALITVFNLNPLITTLATAGVFRGFIYIVTNTKPVSGLPANFIFIGQGSVLGIPIPILIMIVSVIAIFILINRTVFGRRAIAIGGGRNAAIVSGVSLPRIRFAVYGVMGLMAALAGAVQTARSASAQVGAGDGIELDAIAAVVIGGTALWGGNARIIGTVFGCLIVGMVANGLNLLAINANWQVVAKGALILLAIVIDSVSTQLVQQLRRRSRLRTERLQAVESPATTEGVLQ
ncbi:ABC transporter permease [Subtercola frigoramans]|uniref:Ribose/xylose/arabinose/galactoside ABC-type transport system permease subunit n=1 Tax=Subtercola frigoramans TaxID=120298 RepID=A0ABS2L721_9MICO|nr:ABC transporter permease [Subtercola frigoramans]MBM7472905.1 ribose/xylose/arabinose/galactoside ABC-type transport system permease subunit [Subtercola frigoramans]